MFRLRLHPTSSGLAIGFAVIALWALLWLWFLAQLNGNGSPTSERWAGTSEPELTLRELREPAA
jgi:hypothetical protein